MSSLASVNVEIDFKRREVAAIRPKQLKRGPKRGQAFFKMPKVEFDLKAIKEIKKRKAKVKLKEVKPGKCKPSRKGR